MSVESGGTPQEWGLRKGGKDRRIGQRKDRTSCVVRAYAKAQKSMGSKKKGGGEKGRNAREPKVREGLNEEGKKFLLPHVAGKKNDCEEQHAPKKQKKGNRLDKGGDEVIGRFGVKTTSGKAEYRRKEKGKKACWLTTRPLRSGVGNCGSKIGGNHIKRVEGKIKNRKHGDTAPDVPLE